MTLTPCGTQKASRGPDVVFIDLDRSMALLEEAEGQEPRLSAADLSRAESERDPDRRRLWRATRICTRIAIERVAGPIYRKVDFSIAPGGRPEISGGPYFSISHCGTTALVAVSTAGPVGVDIERQRPLNVTPGRRQGIVEAGNRLVGEESSHSIEDEAVLKAWVRLEAAGKAIGSGVGELLTEAGIVGGRRSGTLSERTLGLHVRDLEVGQRCFAAIAASTGLPKTIELIAFPDEREKLAEFLSAHYGK